MCFSMKARGRPLCLLPLTIIAPEVVAESASRTFLAGLQRQEDPSAEAHATCTCKEKFKS